MTNITIPIGAVTLDEAERLVIEATIDDAGSISQAARVLEVQRVTLIRKRKKWKAIEQPPTHATPTPNAGTPEKQP